jgi:hypothetical protein
VVKETQATQCILVSDGAEDEFVIPIIQSKIPVTSIRRVIVNQMPNLEGTYYILKKLGLSAEEFDTIMNLPPKTFHDYPSYYPLMQLLRYPIRYACPLGIPTFVLFLPEVVWMVKDVCSTPSYIGVIVTIAPSVSIS